VENSVVASGIMGNGLPKTRPIAHENAKPLPIIGDRARGVYFPRMTTLPYKGRTLQARLAPKPGSIR